MYFLMSCFLRVNSFRFLEDTIQDKTEMFVNYKIE